MSPIENEQQQNPVMDLGFYAPIPRVVRTGYKTITPIQKWLYTCLKDLCGDHGTCYRSLRVLSQETGISTGLLSESIPELHNAGLIHAEKKKRSTGGKEVWHITIVDIWQANGKAHPTRKCSQDEQTSMESSENVQEMNKECSHDERECSQILVRSNTNKAITTKEKDTYDADASLPHIFSDDELLALLRERGYSVTNQPELSTPDTANVDKLETEPLATSNPIATDTQEAPTQNENGSHESPPQGRAQPEKKPRAPRVQKPEKVVLTPQAQAFYDLYCSMPWIKIAPEITEKVGDQCEKLGAHLTTQEQLFKLRTFMSRKPFFKGKGFTFGLLVLALNDYASEQEPIDLQKRRDEANRNTPSLPTQSDAEKEAKIQECKAALARLKEQERLSQVYPGRMGA